MPRRFHSRAQLIATALGALTLAGCVFFNPFDPRVAPNRGVSQPPPRPDSPRNVLRLFKWCWEHRSITEYREIFTDDFRFAFSTADSAGSPYLDRGFTRDDELASATHLFLGGDAHQPRANRITLDFDPPELLAYEDSRPGKNGVVHREIFTHVLISIDTDDGVSTTVTSSARFFVVRGDSALIPQELKDRGFGPDSTRWYIERYEEQGEQGAASAAVDQAGLRVANPAAVRVEALPRRVSWGYLKVLYR